MRAAVETLRTAREMAAIVAALACFAIGAALALALPSLRAVRAAFLVSAILASPFLICAACDALAR